MLSLVFPRGGTDWLNEDEPSSGVITPDLSASDAEIESRTQRVRTARAQQERAARQERARIRRNILLIAQLADRVVTTAPVVSNIVTGTLSALAENSSAPLSYDRIVIDELRPKDQNFTPPDLVSLVDIRNDSLTASLWNHSTQMREEPAQALAEAFTQIRDLGITHLRVGSAYRSYQSQQIAFANNNYNVNYSRPPGTSSHQTGDAFDFCTALNQCNIDNLDPIENYLTDEEYEAVVDIMHENGFVLNYTPSSTQYFIESGRTVIQPESWEFIYDPDAVDFLVQNNYRSPESQWSYPRWVEENRMSSQARFNPVHLLTQPIQTFQNLFAHTALQMGL